MQICPFKKKSEIPKNFNCELSYCYNTSFYVHINIFL